MKKQLIVFSFLVGFFSLWGMNQQNIDYKKMLEILQVPQVEDMLADTPEKKEALSFKLFKQFHEKVFEYLKEDQTEKRRLAILQWLGQVLPMMNITFNDKNQAGFIENTLDNPEQAVGNLDQVVKCFLFIYIEYLQHHPEQLCGVLFRYFQIDLMRNQYYRSLLQIMLSILGAFADEVLDVPQISNIQAWSDMTRMAGDYIQNYKSLPSQRFTEVYKNIYYICGKFNDAVQSQKQASAEDDIAAMPLDKEIPAPSPEEEQKESDSFLYKAAQNALAEALKEKKQKKVLESPNGGVQQQVFQENTTKLPQIPLEAQPQPTTWQTVIDWIWWVNDGIESLVGRVWEYFRGTKN